MPPKFKYKPSRKKRPEDKAPRKHRRMEEVCHRLHHYHVFGTDDYKRILLRYIQRIIDDLEREKLQNKRLTELLEGKGPNGDLI